MSWQNIFKRSKVSWVQPKNCVGLSSAEGYYKVPILPNDYKSILFCPQTDDVHKDFLAMSCDVINQLTQPYYVVTHTQELIPDFPLKTSISPKTYASDYHRFFSAFGVAHAISDDSSQLIVQTEPGNTALTALLRDENIYTTYFTMYAFTRPIAITRFSETLPLTENFDYTLRLEFDITSGGLYVAFNTNHISQNTIRDVIAEVCVRYGKTLDSEL